MAKGRKTGGGDFVPGKSGNPKGRPKKLPAEVIEAAKAHTVEAIETLVTWMRSDQGSVAISAADKILDRGWGKAKETHDLNVGLDESIIRLIAEGRERARNRA